ncbi:MAG: hypothetical protein PWP03_222 [Candidatus Woesearchaeota archaeon]|nr:hypothetical protein [Candidatus Woesearchaeota archaeon]
MVLKYINEVLEKNGLSPQTRIEKGLAELKKFNLLEYLNIDKTDYNLLDEKKLTILNEPISWPLNYIYYSNPEIGKKSENKLRQYLAGLEIEIKGITASYEEYKQLKDLANRIDISSYKPCFHDFSILRLYSKRIVEKFNEKYLTEKKITLEDLVSKAIEYLRSSYQDFLAIQYKTPHRFYVRQFISENDEGIFLFEQDYSKILIRKYLYNNNAIIFVPSKSSDKMHTVYLYNVPTESTKFNPFFDWSRFYSVSTVEIKDFSEISSRKKEKIISYITAHEVEAFLFVLSKLEQDKFLTPILLPNKEFRKKIRLLRKSITYDPVFNKYRTLNKTELEMYSMRLLKHDASLKLISHFKRKKKTKNSS